LQIHFPLTVATLERPLEPVLAELSGEGLPTNRSSEGAAFPNGPVDVHRIDSEPSLAGDVPALDSERNHGWLASSNGRCRRTAPLAVERSSGASITELRKKQYVSDRSDKKALHLFTQAPKIRCWSIDPWGHGLAVKVTNDFYLIGLSSADADRERIR
jgi:hypothetical protein